MRALCEGCGKPQPPDWKAGDLCSHCRKSVRHDVRCYWCAKWTPAAKFCRSCGAAVVEEKLYGAARMLKEAGTDRFTIPKQLKEFDPDQVENFSRIYQRHAVAVARHVDELHFLERFLHNKTFSTALEEQLVPQLPWPEETLARMSTPTRPPGDDLATLQAIQETTPFPTTKALATLVRLTKRDGDVYKDACSVLYTDDPALKDEAVLALTSWRIASTWGRPRNAEKELIETLQKSPHTLEAAVRLGHMGRGKEDLLKEALTSPDPETAFCAALVLGDVDRLQAALKGDDLQKSVAGSKLISLGVIKPVIQEIPKSTKEIQQDLVESLLRRKEPAPEAADALIEIVEKTDDDTLRERASRLLCRALKPNWVLRIARAAKKDHHIYQNLLQAPDLPPEATVELADFLLAEGRFTLNQYGMDKLADNPALPPSYVATRFGRADNKTKIEMLRFAERQLEKRKHDGLHQFVMKVAFGPHPHEVRAAAWWTLHRWYRSGGEYRGEGPFKLTKEQLDWFFGSVSAFMPNLTAVLRSHDTLKEVGYYEMIANVLKTADAEAIEEMQAEGDACKNLLDALLEAAAGDYWPNTLESMIILAAQLGGDIRWRESVLTRLRALGKKGNYHYDKAVRRLELAKHGIPEEDEWKSLPEDFAGSRFWKADPEGQRELLKVVDQQLIHSGDREKRSSVLCRFLLEVAMTSDDAEIVEQAHQMHADRAPNEMRRFRLTREAVEKAYGPFPDFLKALPKALKAAAQSESRESLSFFSQLFSRPEPADAALLASEEKAGHALIKAILEIAAMPVGKETSQMSLRRDLIRYLGTAATSAKWSKEVLKALEKVLKSGGELKVEFETLQRKLQPPVMPKPRMPSISHPKQEEEPEAEETPAPEAIDYVKLQKKAEKMGVELQAKMMKLMAGPGTPEEKMKEGTRLSAEFQAAIKKLYGQ